MSSKSKQLTEIFGITLPDELISWFDSDLKKNMPMGSFNEFIHPEDIPGSIWGGQMLPDTLPITGNGCGDVLSLRFGTEGTLSEVLHWAHEGSQWNPWAKTFSEALLVDIAVSMDTGDYWQGLFQESEPVFSWVLKWVTADDSKREELRSVLLNEQIARVPRLLDFGLGEIVVFKHMCQKCLNHPLLEAANRQGGITIADYLGVDWNTIQPWLSDPTLIPGTYRDSLVKYLGIGVEELVTIDWKGAARWAEKVVQKRIDLAWPFVVLGKYAETQRDDMQVAEYFASEMRAFMTTYDFTETWITPLYGGKPKLEQVESLLPDSELFEFLRIKANRETRDYWLHQARFAEKQNNYPRAYRCWYAAGWDEFFTNDMDVILQGLINSAEAAGYNALAKIASYHLENL